MHRMATDDPPLLMPQQFEALLMKAIDAHDAATKANTRDAWAKADTLLEEVRSEYARIYDKINQAMIEDLRR